MFIAKERGRCGVTRRNDGIVMMPGLSDKISCHSIYPVSRQQPILCVFGTGLVSVIYIGILSRYYSVSRIGLYSLLPEEVKESVPKSVPPSSSEAAEVHVELYYRDHDDFFYNDVDNRNGIV